MERIGYKVAKRNFENLLERVCKDHSPIIINCEGSKAVVMMSLEDYNSFEETNYLLHSPENAKRLLESLNELEPLTNKYF